MNTARSTSTDPGTPWRAHRLLSKIVFTIELDGPCGNPVGEAASPVGRAPLTGTAGSQAVKGLARTISLPVEASTTSRDPNGSASIHVNR